MQNNPRRLDYRFKLSFSEAHNHERDRKGRRGVKFSSIVSFPCRTANIMRIWVLQKKRSGELREEGKSRTFQQKIWCILAIITGCKIVLRHWKTWSGEMNKIVSNGQLILDRTIRRTIFIQLWGPYMSFIQEGWLKGLHGGICRWMGAVFYLLQEPGMLGEGACGGGMLEVLTLCIWKYTCVFSK